MHIYNMYEQSMLKLVFWYLEEKEESQPFAQDSPANRAQT